MNGLAADADLDQSAETRADLSLSPEVVCTLAEAGYEACSVYQQSVDGEDQVRWHDLDDVNRNMIISRAAYFTNSDTKAGDLHDAWLREAKRNGWRFGKRFEPEAMRDPRIRPWHHLPHEQQIADHIFRATVLGLVSVLVGVPPSDEPPPDPSQTH